MPTTTPIQERPGTASPTGRGAERRRRTPTPRIQQNTIEGRYRAITTTQLVLTWWLYAAGHITRRQLRVTFAAHEMAERRFYTAEKKKGCAAFTLDELKALVGGRGTATADRDLSADLKRLSEIGLVKIDRRSITFAESVEQVAVEETAGFFAMWDQMDSRTRGRSVPVPRRTLRALAAGFTRGATAYLIASLIRCVFWQRSARCYTVDGRIKDGWVADTFGLGLSAVRAGRRELTSLGLLEKKDGVPQWLLNRYGNHIVVQCDWSPSDADANNAVENTDTTPVGEGGSAGKSDTPPAQNSGRSDTLANRSALPTEDLETRRLGGEPPDPAGVSLKTDSGRRKKRGRPSGAMGEPTIWDIQPHDFEDTDRLFKLHTQFVEFGIAKGGRAGELDFLALAHRAKVRGTNPGGLLRRLLERGCTSWITIADEDAAAKQLRNHLSGPPATAIPEEGTRSIRHLIQPRRMPGTETEGRRLSPEGAFVEQCVRAARQAGLREGQWWRVAQHIKQWSSDQWDAAYSSYQHEQARHWLGRDKAVAMERCI